MREGDLIAGKYRLLRPIGAGAMASVWAARHELLGRDVALKFPRLPARASVEARARFLREARIASGVRHANVVDVADAGEAPDGGLYLAMELLDGVSLAQHLAERGKLAPREVLLIAREVAGGLSAAHRAGVVHRDVKPENVFLARGPGGGTRVLLLDFGVSKLGESEGAAAVTTSFIGTPAYMSPEQALGELSIDHRTDLWSLGVVLYELVAGRHPFVAPSYPALLPRIAEEPFDPLHPDVPAPLAQVIARCLEKRPADRFASAAELHQAIDSALLEVPEERPSSLHIDHATPLPSRAPRTPATDPPPSGTLSPSIRMRAMTTPSSRKLQVGVVAASLAVIVGAGWAARRAPEPAAAETGAAARGPTPVEPALLVPPSAAAAPPASPPASATATEAAPSPSASAAAPAFAGVKPRGAPIASPSAPASKPAPSGRSVTRVNTAGF